ncbi:MAG: DegT/DnrJ/EryC1/StrS family aminotransferase [Chloroflexi bacterium]|nr:DegT/DnrJ/EryC1/StrS family aminotransferase [Chloroflexota bacterium]
MSIAWVDRAAQYQAMKPAIDAAIQRVLASGVYEDGEEVHAFEREFAAYIGRRFAVSVGSGSDAIMLTLKAWGLGPDDEVISPANSCQSVPLAIAHSGARIVLADIEERTCNIDPASVEAAISPRTRVILAMHGHGIPCEIDPLMDIARRHGLKLLDDATVATGARYRGQRLGSLGHAGVFSFGHGKMLTAPMNGAGIVLTDSEETAAQVRTLARYGTRPLRDDDDVPAPYRLSGSACVELGYNSCLGSLQAAVLRAKLPGLDPWLERRRTVAQRYHEGLQGLPVVTPDPPPYMEPVYRGYLVRLPRRDQVFHALKAQGIGVNLLYLPPVHLHPAFRYLGYREGDFPVTERVARQMLSLPLYPEMTNDQVDQVVAAIRDALQP